MLATGGLPCHARVLGWWSVVPLDVAVAVGFDGFVAERVVEPLWRRDERWFSLRNSSSVLWCDTTVVAHKTHTVAWQALTCGRKLVWASVVQVMYDTRHHTCGCMDTMGRHTWSPQHSVLVQHGFSLCAGRSLLLWAV